jgi:hypothetical protein
LKSTQKAKAEGEEFEGYQGNFKWINDQNQADRAGSPYADFHHIHNHVGSGFADFCVYLYILSALWSDSEAMAEDFALQFSGSRSHSHFIHFIPDSVGLVEL